MQNPGRFIAGVGQADWPLPRSVVWSPFVVRVVIDDRTAGVAHGTGAT
jgi:hypothetical protein